MAKLILKINGQIKENSGNKDLGTFEIVSYDEEVLENDPHPNRIHAHLTTINTKGEVVTSEKGIIAGINDPAQPLTFAIAVETVNKEIEYAGMMVFFNEKKKFKGRMFPPNESIMLACAREEENIKAIKDLIKKRNAGSKKLVAFFDEDNTHIIVSGYKQNALNIHQKYDNASLEELAALL